MTYLFSKISKVIYSSLIAGNGCLYIGQVDRFCHCECTTEINYSNCNWSSYF